MDLQDHVNLIVKEARVKRLESSDQMTLGELIRAIQPIVNDKRKNKPNVGYDFEYLFPTSIDSWRGSYDELALNFTNEGEQMNVDDFLIMLKYCIGKEFTGYKGGEYVMHENTPIWVANYGNSGSTALVNVVDDGWRVILITAFRKY